MKKLLSLSLVGLMMLEPVAQAGTLAQKKQAQPGTSSEITGAIPRTASSAASPLLKAGLDALSRDDIGQALAIRDRLRGSTLDRHILTWAIAVSGAPGVPSSEIAEAQGELRGWPGLERLRALSEKALYRENPSAGDVVAAFGDTQPETAEGAFILASALRDTGNPKRAAKVWRKAWRTMVFDTALETRALKALGGLMTAADHKARMDLLLYNNRITQAKRMSSLGQAQSLYNAWSAVLNKSSQAASLLKAVDPRWKNDPGYLFARVQYNRRKENWQTAATLLGAMPRDRDALVDPGAWWNEQRIVSRGLMDDGHIKAAYRIAAGEVAEEQADQVEAQFHAGWYALRGLKDPATASKHFRAILKASSRPLSVSRAYYWLGRAAEAAGDPNAAEFYARAARHPATFYGQIAAAKLKRQTLNVSYPSPGGEDRARFQSREAVQAISRLEAAGHGHRARKLYMALAEQLDSPGELALLAARAEKSGDHQLSLNIGKTAYSRGIDAAALAFPVGVIPKSANISGSGKALAYAIARQESAFNPAAVSAANARGLLQLLPSTAKTVAKRNGIAFSKDRLTTDAGYNATLGAHYLGEQIDTFNGSYIMTFIAYNAGPRRVGEWVARYGDPRGKSIEEVVDWIERIPFTETRNYVQRVMENYEVYKSRLGQQASIVEDLRFGRYGRTASAE
ncbi:lytic transglycosylase domain-containing protein [Gellertiella hungarica]|uniref:Soluble lytic murein transglycosylase n=1 Tax=Gellertiella hungarica TaxID=1572859 RepID=A0A7W6J6C3_9HYPH|nr:lytic transglycosylase domain-containing protein [Gellertiella hungarica]MBB4065611.1 soluble lytic murein transglycosylase [Gellertiella hungarica]